MEQPPHSRFLSNRLIKFYVQLNALSWSIVPRKVPSSRKSSASSIFVLFDRSNGLSVWYFGFVVLGFLLIGLPPRKSLKLGIIMHCVVLEGCCGGCFML